MKKLFKHIQVERALNDIRFLCKEIGPRMSGTAEELRVVSYLKEAFESIGLPFEIYELDAFVSYPSCGIVEIVSPAKEIIEAISLAQIESTPPEGKTGELIYVGSGALQDYEHIDVKGSFVLAKLNSTPPRPEKARIAEEKGAIGLILMNWGPSEKSGLPFGAAKSIWGNPTPENFSDLPGIPAVGITRLSGEKLRNLCYEGKVSVCIHAHATREWRKVYLPVAKLEGIGADKDKFVICGGHYDCWNEGATCNASGNAATIEIARALYNVRNHLKRSVWFVFWPGHEMGIMEGSSWFVDYFWDELKQNAILYVNLDSLGMVGGKDYYAQSAELIKEFHLDVEKRVLGYSPRHIRQGKTGDHSFLGVGVPAIDSRYHHTTEQIAKWHGANFGWWYHSKEDTFDKIDGKLLKKEMHINAAYIYEMCTADLIPYDPVSTAEEIRNRLIELDTVYKTNVPLQECRNLAENLCSLLEKRIDLYKSITINDYSIQNNIMLQLARILIPLTSTVCGPYGQDTFGLTDLNYSLPILYQLEKLHALNPESHEAKLIYTKMLRNRNRLIDGLRFANQILECNGVRE